MDIIRYFEIVIKLLNGKVYGRLRFERNGQLEESGLFTIAELNDVLTYWRRGELLGSFAIGTKLEVDAAFQLVNE